MSINRRLALAVSLLTIAAAGGCAKADRVRPVKAGAVDTGTGSLESVRRRLEGNWSLVSLETVGASGAKTTVAATGTLSYDAFGNFTLAGKGADASLPPALNLKGRAVIDAAASRLRIVDAESTAGDVPAAAAVDRVREYAFAGDRLVLTVKDAQGKTTAVTTWQRAK